MFELYLLNDNESKSLRIFLLLFKSLMLGKLLITTLNA